MHFLITAPGSVQSAQRALSRGAARRPHCIGHVFVPKCEGWNVSSFVRAACLAVFAVLVVAAATHRLLPRVLLPHLLPTVLPGELLPHVLPSLFLLCPLFLSPVTVCALYLSVLLLDAMLCF